MDWMDILERIESGEGLHVEFKRGLGDLSPIGKAVSAFANTQGGVIILGVDDAGTIVGVKEDPERVQERLTNFLQSGCSAPVSARLGRQEDPAGWVHWIEVPRQRGFEPLRHDGRVWVRRGRSNVEPSPPELQELYNVFGYVLTEEQAITSASESDIDLASFRVYLRGLGLETDASPQPDQRKDLYNRGVLTEVGEEFHPTLYGLMAFGKDPQRCPQTASFWVECVAYAGKDRADDVVLTGEAKGRLVEQVQRAVGWMRGLGRFEHYAGLVRKDEPLVPEAALREALVNAVAHRNYAILGSKVLLEVFDDRVVITSPGALPNHMTPASVRSGGHPRSRNELMANFLLVMGLMEQRGRGWPVMTRVMREFNGTDPELEQDPAGGYVRARLRVQVRP